MRYAVALDTVHRSSQLFKGGMRELMPRPRLTVAVLPVPDELTDVMSRLPVRVDRVLDLDAGIAFANASAECHRCRDANQKSYQSCRDWRSATEEGAAHEVPTFCPVSEFLKRVLRDDQVDVDMVEPEIHVSNGPSVRQSRA